MVFTSTESSSTMMIGYEGPSSVDDAPTKAGVGVKFSLQDNFALLQQGIYRYHRVHLIAEATRSVSESSVTNQSKSPASYKHTTDCDPLATSWIAAENPIKSTGVSSVTAMMSFSERYDFPSPCHYGL